MRILRFGEVRNNFPYFPEVCERREKGEFEEGADSKFPPPPPPPEEEADSILAALSKVMGNKETIIQILSMTYLFRSLIYYIYRDGLKS